MSSSPSRPPFVRFAQATARAAGHPGAFLLASAAVVVWAATGPLFGYSDTWQLVINTSTTIITFLMVFLIQNTQNRDSHALQIKVDELIRVVQGADTALLDLEELDEGRLERIRAAYAELAARARSEQRAGRGGAEADSPAARLDQGTRRPAEGRAPQSKPPPAP